MSTLLSGYPIHGNDDALSYEASSIQGARLKRSAFAIVDVEKVVRAGYTNDCFIMSLARWIYYCHVKMQLNSILIRGRGRGGEGGVGRYYGRKSVTSRRTAHTLSVIRGRNQGGAWFWAGQVVTGACHSTGTCTLQEALACSRARFLSSWPYI